MADSLRVDEQQCALPNEQGNDNSDCSSIVSNCSTLVAIQEIYCPSLTATVELLSLSEHISQTTMLSNGDSDSGSGGIETTSSSTSSSIKSSVFSVNSTYWSLLSNILFFIGSALQVWLAVWDKKKEVFEDNDDSYDDDGNDYDDGYAGDGTWIWTNYHSLCTISALMLIGNSIVDIIWSVRDANSHWRRDTKYQIAAAIAFGVAASCDLASVFLSSGKNFIPGYILSTVAVHVYLFNAVLSIQGSDASCRYLSSTLTTSGDFLFLLASIIDIVLNYIGYPMASDATWHFVDIANLASSSLWLVDAILYIAADIVDMKEYYSEFDMSSDISSTEVGGDDEECEYLLLLNDSFEIP